MSDRELTKRQQLYLEKYGDAIVTNNYLRRGRRLLTRLGLVISTLKDLILLMAVRCHSHRPAGGARHAGRYKASNTTPETGKRNIPVRICRLYYAGNATPFTTDFTKALFSRRQVANEHDGTA